MSWTDWISTALAAYGAYEGRKDAKKPDAPQALSYDQLLNLMMQNSNSPWGNTSYTKGQDGRVTRDYTLPGQQQDIFNRLQDRSLNPDQAYQKPNQLNQLQQALMNARLARMGITPQPDEGGVPRNFTQGPQGNNYGPDQTHTTQTTQTTPPGPPGGSTAGSNERSSEGGGNRGTRDAGYSPGIDPWRGVNGTGSQGWTDEQLEWIEKYFGNKLISGAAGQLVPGAGLAMGLGGWWAGNSLNNRYSNAMYDRQHNGVSPGYGVLGQLGAPSSPTNPNYYNPMPGWVDPGINPLTGARLGQAGGMPGSVTREGDFSGDRFATRGSAAFGSGGPWQNDGSGGFVFAPHGYAGGGGSGDLVWVPKPDKAKQG